VDLPISDEAGHLQVLDQQVRCVDVSEEIGPAGALGFLSLLLGLEVPDVDGRDAEDGPPVLDFRLALLPLDHVDFVGEPDVREDG
jgi:hypothetical protein